jgi:hypothetical protein
VRRDFAALISDYNEAMSEPLSRRRALSVIGGAVSAAALARIGSGAAGAQEPDGRPNIIYIMTDDHAAHAGSTRRRTWTDWRRRGCCSGTHS